MLQRNVQLDSADPLVSAPGVSNPNQQVRAEDFQLLAEPGTPVTVDLTRNSTGDPFFTDSGSERGSAHGE